MNKSRNERRELFSQWLIGMTEYEFDLLMFCLAVTAYTHSRYTFMIQRIYKPPIIL